MMVEEVNPISNIDKSLENSLRPISLDEFEGQKNTITNLKVYTQAAMQRKEPLDHVLLHSPPGLGKTTLAHIIAFEMKANIKVSSGTILEKPSDLAGILTSINTGDVFFIDEMHRLHPTIEEFLYTAMEDFFIDILIDTGPNARSVQIKLNPFTLVGATTRSGMLTEALRSRFGITIKLDYYEHTFLNRIIKKSAKALRVPIEERAAKEIATRSKGTPRYANNLLKRVRDFAQIHNKGYIDLPVTLKSLQSMHIDQEGLDEMDNFILTTIISKFKGGPVGINTIATACNEKKETIEEIYEPFLIRSGFIKRTSRGRQATEKAYNYLKLSMPLRLL